MRLPKLISIPRQQGIIIAVILAMCGVLIGPYVEPVRAATAPFQEVIVRLDRMAASTATSGRVCAQRSTANSAQAVAFVDVTFPSGFTVNATAANWTVTTTNLDSGQTAWPGIGTATTVSGQTVEFPSTDLTTTTNLYCFNFSGTSTLTNGTAGSSQTGTVATKLTGPGAVIDQSSYAVSVISNDQITVNATVPPTFVFQLSGNSDSFTGNLSPASLTSTTGTTVTIQTNAASGWTVWAKDANSSGGKGSLKSTTAGNYLITGTTAIGTASHALSNGTEDYGLGVTVTTDYAGGGTVTANANYDGSASKAGTLDAVNLQPIASSNGTAGGTGDVITLTERATIAGNTPAATDYGDTITVVGAGSF